MAVERLKACDNIVALSQELGVHRRLLYQWRDRSEPFDDEESPPGSARESTLRQQNSQQRAIQAGPNQINSLGSLIHGRNMFRDWIAV